MPPPEYAQISTLIHMRYRAKKSTKAGEMTMNLLIPARHRDPELLRLLPFRLLGAPLIVVDNAES